MRCNKILGNHVLSHVTLTLTFFPSAFLSSCILGLHFHLIFFPLTFCTIKKKFKTEDSAKLFFLLCFNVSLLWQKDHKIVNQSASSRPISELQLTKPSDWSAIIPVIGENEQTLIQTKKDSLAESSVLSLIYDSYLWFWCWTCCLWWHSHPWCPGAGYPCCAGSQRLK